MHLQAVFSRKHSRTLALLLSYECYGFACCRYYFITGRVDDVINVSGHRIGTAEVEGALDEHPACAEAAVVGYTTQKNLSKPVSFHIQ